MSEILKCPKCGDLVLDEFGKCWVMNKFNANKADTLCYHCGESQPFHIWGKIPVTSEIGYTIEEARVKWPTIAFPELVVNHV